MNQPKSQVHHLKNIWNSQDDIILIRTHKQLRLHTFFSATSVLRRIYPERKFASFTQAMTLKDLDIYIYGAVTLLYSKSDCLYLLGSTYKETTLSSAIDPVILAKAIKESEVLLRTHLLQPTS